MSGKPTIRVEWESELAFCYEGLRQALSAGDIDAVRDWTAAARETQA